MYPLLSGSALLLSWKDFSLQIKQRAITLAGQWCSAYNATQSFCPAPQRQQLHKQRLEAEEVECRMLLQEWLELWLSMV